MKIGVISDLGDVLYHPPRLGCGEGYDIPAFVETLRLAVPAVSRRLPFALLGQIRAIRDSTANFSRFRLV